MDRPLIMITNDDGIHSPGLKAAAEAVADMGDLLIAAPHTQQTGRGRAFPYTEETGIIDAVEISINGRLHTAYAVHGSPAYAVAHGVLELAGRKPDLCISGINYGENLGTTITCSGTLGAAFEANSYGIPAIAVSISAELRKQRLNEFDEIDWNSSKKILQIYTEQVLTEGMPKDVGVWNINVPAGMKEPYTYRITSQSVQNYFNFIRPPKRNYREPYRLKSKLEVDRKTLEKDSDIYAIYIDQIISVTPLKIQMSARVL